jgi:hypothetical protein
MGTQGQNTINITSIATSPPTDQAAYNKKKGMMEDESSKDVLAKNANLKKKLEIDTNLNLK